LFWELARHKHWQEQLREELLAVFKGGAHLPYKEIMKLPILDAIVNEALRMHPAAPGGLPRETPKGGRIIGASFIPAKVGGHKPKFYLIR
jgi:cytochrome P450 family 628